jgi:hypothetical protein
MQLKEEEPTAPLFFAPGNHLQQICILGVVYVRTESSEESQNNFCKTLYDYSSAVLAIH